MVKKATVIATGMLLLSMTTAQACPVLNTDDEGPFVTLTGKVIHKPFKILNDEPQRQYAGYYLKLDKPILLKEHEEEEGMSPQSYQCYGYPEIYIGEQDSKIKKWHKKHVSISGRLSRAASALSVPGVSIREPLDTQNGLKILAPMHRNYIECGKTLCHLDR